MVSIGSGGLRRYSCPGLCVALAEDEREATVESVEILARPPIRRAGRRGDSYRIALYDGRRKSRTVVAPRRLRAANHRRDLPVSGRPQYDDKARAAPSRRADD